MPYKSCALFNSHNHFRLILLVACLLPACSTAPKPAECKGEFKPINASKSKVAATKNNQEIAEIQVRCIAEKQHG